MLFGSPRKDFNYGIISESREDWNLLDIYVIYFIIHLIKD